jgi:hypothetical protein
MIDQISHLKQSVEVFFSIEQSLFAIEILFFQENGLYFLFLTGAR